VPGPEPLTLPMAAAVGYDVIDCRHGSRVEDSLVLKHDRLFALLDDHGNVAPPGDCGRGLFFDDTRVLSHYQLRMAGGPATLLSSDVSRMYAGQIDLAISASAFGGDTWNASNVIHVRRELLLDDRLTERATITNFSGAPVDYWIELHLANDFADIFEVRGWQRPERGTFFRPQHLDRGIRFRYRGRDGHVISSAVIFVTPPDEREDRCVRWRMILEPHRTIALEWQVLPDVPADEDAGASAIDAAFSARPFAERRSDAERTYAHWREQVTRWRTDVEEFDMALHQATGDLRALYVEIGGRPVISAGIPWYSTAFGRDSIIASLQTLNLTPRIAVDTLRFLAAYQGSREDPFTEEQPGKILHEIRRGEMARAREIPHIPYYGSVDATPLWLVLLHETWRWTGDAALVREMLPHARRALEWIDRYGDLDGDGFVEYARGTPNGLVNQGWKDSWDGIPFPSGQLPRAPIALVEVQGYVYDAKMRMAAIYEAFGEAEEAAALRRSATALREKICDSFWLEELGTFALALDADKKPLPTVASNAGHLLWSRVPDARRAALLRDRLLAPDMFSGWGIRTLSASHLVFNPMSYHDGSVWPHDNALIALGLSLYDLSSSALPILTELQSAARQIRYRRLPELFCGMERADDGHPVLYPVSCSPQAWAAGAFFMLLQAVTGILPDAPADTLHIRDPILPPFLSELLIEGLRVGGSRVTLQFTRRGARTLANLLVVEGEPIKVSIDLR